MHKSDKKCIYGILVIFYENYYENAINEFKNFLQCLSDSYELIIVSNNKNIISNKYNFYYPDKSQSEFAAWEYGFNKIKKINNEDIFIFANDTFCHHRPWGRLEREIFYKSFKSILVNEFCGISGATNSFGKPYKIGDFSSNKWVSTYLFLLSGSALRFLMDKFLLSDAELNKIFYDVNGHEILWSNSVDTVLKDNLENWLNPRNKNGWYNRNVEGLKKKIKLSAIINELYISALLNSHVFAINDVYDKIRFKDYLIIKIKRQIFKIKNAFKN